MARRNNLEDSPIHEAEAAQRVRARVSPLSRTRSKFPARNGKDGETAGDFEEDDALRNGITDAASQQDDFDGEDADGLAGVINDASLSGANISGAKHVSTATEGKWSRTMKTIVGFIGGSAQKPAGPSGETPEAGKGLARPSVTYEDISRLQKARRSGRPDPYVVPQSPPRSLTPEPQPTAPKRRDPKPKSKTTQELNEQVVVAVVVGEASGLDKERLEGLQDHFEHTGEALRRTSRAISESEERNTRPKRVTRSTRRTVLDVPGKVQHQPERQQRKAMRGSQEDVQFSSSVQSGTLTRKDQMGGRDAETQDKRSAADIASPDDGLGDGSKSKTGTVKTDSRKRLQNTHTKRPSKIGKIKPQGRAQNEPQEVSPIPSCSTLAKAIQRSQRLQQRPSQQSFLVPRATQGRKSKGSSPKVMKEYPATDPTSSQIPGDFYEETSEEEEDHQDRSGVSRSLTPTRVITSDNANRMNFIDVEKLERMEGIIAKAGQSKDGKRKIPDLSCYSKTAKTICNAADGLTSKYEAMKRLRSTDDVDVSKVKQEHGKALKLLGIICKSAQSVLANRLGNRNEGEYNADDKYRSHILEDLYLYVIPRLVQTLSHAVRSRQNQNALEISDMEEFYLILKVLYDLVERSRSEDKSVQPKPRGIGSYSISGPTRKLRKVLRKLYKESGEKLKVAARAQRFQQAQPSRGRKRKEWLEAEEREEGEQFQQRLRERNKAIIASLNERRAELGLPPCSQPNASPPITQQPQAPKHRAEEAFDDVDHDTGGRLVGVFGSKNSHPGTTPTEWTVEEMKILVDGLRRDRGPTRYEKLVTRLERTLDEIFDRAKYLKMQMEYTLKRLQEEHTDEEFPQIKPWIENIGSEGFLTQ